MNKVFIDGQAGTTGLQVQARIQHRQDIDIIEIDKQHRKSIDARRTMMNAADLVILCLPDQAAREAVTLVTSDNVRLLDASSAHRVTEGWVYGLPEMGKAQTDAIRTARFVSNPGCYPTGAILLLKPLIDQGLIDATYPVAINAISGYSGGGRDAIEQFECSAPDTPVSAHVKRYALHHQHKHIQEITAYSGLAEQPIFMPLLGAYRQGILLQIPVQLSALGSPVTADQLREQLLHNYRESTFVKVLTHEETSSLNDLEPDTHNNTNRITLCVLSPEGSQQAVLCAVYDNLGKGASGAAVQNIEIMLGLAPLDGNVKPLV